MNNNQPSLGGFEQYAAERDDRLLMLSTGHFTEFDYVVDVAGQTVKLITKPEDLVFQDKWRVATPQERLCRGKLSRSRESPMECRCTMSHDAQQFSE
ncbi:hypothetical protein FBQ96_02160 [Nitrospirales bacterium NOB]|nr:MAG: hypothetical protein UZ03_NOB001003132 [Nitrospira sp. OLB3]MBV6471345.1 hypothetical protein [Nitrospirota bacterium]MCK6492064.1 hypothetical protein [Nitrospira sp.]MDL1888384.1 hypothetical protein [Nitrospirales bacterium NOB]MEB2338800.1 hypothetical protein [Nitrospirales bacterium]